MSTDTGPTSKAELRDALDMLVQAAYVNGVEVDNGGYALTHADPTIPDWEIHITRTTKPIQSDE